MNKEEFKKEFEKIVKENNFVRIYLGDCRFLYADEYVNNVATTYIWLKLKGHTTAFVCLADIKGLN
jgi:hypothetical protein